MKLPIIRGYLITKLCIAIYRFQNERFMINESPNHIKNQNQSWSNAGLERGEDRESASKAPKIALPKGGDVIQGIGEKFQVNPVTGTGPGGIPITLSLGRSGFTPQLALSYDSGAGNSSFGMGWGVDLPSTSHPQNDSGLFEFNFRVSSVKKNANYFILLTARSHTCKEKNDDLFFLGVIHSLSLPTITSNRKVSYLFLNL